MSEHTILNNCASKSPGSSCRWITNSPRLQTIAKCKEKLAPRSQTFGDLFRVKSMSLMGKTLSKLEAPFSTVNATARLFFFLVLFCFFFLAVLSSLLLVSHSNNYLSLYLHYVAMFLFLLNLGEFYWDTMCWTRGVATFTEDSYSNVRSNLTMVNGPESSHSYLQS